MVKQRKIDWVEELTEEIQESPNMLFTDFSGINVQELQTLRGGLRRCKTNYRVVKNRLARLAFEKADSQSAGEEPAGETEPAEATEDQPQLGDLPGVGASKVEALEEKGFKTVASVAEASIDDLTEVSGIGDALGNKIKAAAVEVCGSTSEAAAPEDAAGGIAEKAAPFLSGNTGIAFNQNDMVSAAKAIVDFSKENEELEIKGGLLENRLLTVEEIIELSKLPSRRELLTMVAIGLQGPIRKLAQYLVNPLQKLVWVVDKVKNKKEDSKE